jgi:hypothetical protein
MEVEVSALMGAANEALWKSTGLFTSVDEHGINLKKQVNLSLHSKCSPKVNGLFVSADPSSTIVSSGGAFQIRRVEPEVLVGGVVITGSNVRHTL